MDNNIPIFGHRINGHNYQPRPGAYAVVLDARQNIAAVLTPRGYFLPGGGLDPGESPPDALAREIREECRCDIQILAHLGNATQFTGSPSEGYFAKHCTFFRAAFKDIIGKPTEPDHQLIWLTPAEAGSKLKHASQAWAVASALDLPLAACAILIQDGKILLGKRSPRENLCPNLWDIPGGHLEPGESPAQTLQRELREELRITITEFTELQTIIEFNPQFGGPAAFHLYTVTQWISQPKMLGEEHSELRWFTVDEACRLPDLAHPKYPSIFRKVSGSSL